MRYGSAIKTSIGWIYPVGILTSYILGIIEWMIRRHLVNEGIIYNNFPFISYGICSLIFITIGLLQWFKYKNWIYPVLGLLLGISIILLSLVLNHKGPFIKASFFLILLFIGLLIVLKRADFLGHERYEKNSRRLFRLAAISINETKEGYTERPYAAGSEVYSKEEIVGLSMYLHGKYIIRPFFQETCICFAFSMNKSLTVISDPSEVSHIVFGYDGTIKVVISEKDYKDYRHKLTFIQLCNSMAAVFARFLRYYKNGLEFRIIWEINSSRQ